MRGASRWPPASPGSRRRPPPPPRNVPPKPPPPRRYWKDWRTKKPRIIDRMAGRRKQSDKSPPAVRQREGGTRCGFVALIGAPNAGKSTLLNQLVGAKVSIVSRKAQTTRSTVRGVVVEGA